MGTTDIYSNSDSKIVKLREQIKAATTKPEFVIRQEEDPKYQVFSELIINTAKMYNTEEPKAWKLIGLWFHAPTFQKHWHTISPDTPRWMAWICFLHRLNRIDTGLVVISWMHNHGRNPSPGELKREVSKMLDKVWNEVQPELKKIKDKRNEQQKERRDKQMMTLEQTQKRGRPKLTSLDSLGCRIMNELKKGRSTPTQLSLELGDNINTIKAQLRRLPNVRKIARGLYELGDGETIVEPPSAKKPVISHCPQAVTASPFTTDPTLADEYERLQREFGL